jgi:hypothetical protein
MELDLDLESFRSRTGPPELRLWSWKLEPAPAMHLPNLPRPGAHGRRDRAQVLSRDSWAVNRIGPARGRTWTRPSRGTGGFRVHRLGRQLDRTSTIFPSCTAARWWSTCSFQAWFLPARPCWTPGPRPGHPGGTAGPPGPRTPAASGPGLPGPGRPPGPEQVTGLALSDSTDTPNLLHTYKAKDRALQVVRQGNAVYAVFLALVLALAGSGSAGRRGGASGPNWASCAGASRPSSRWWTRTCC